jgi:putative membrane protein
VFIDYITLLLVNMAAGLVILAVFLNRGLGSPNEKDWAPGLGIVGLVATLVGLHMALTWPIPQLPQVNLKFANPAFGETSVMLGVLFLGAALAVAKGWRLVPVGIYAAVAGAFAILIGMRIAILELTKYPIPTGIGFVFTGLAGIQTLLIVLRPGSRPLRIIAAFDLVVAAAIWSFVAGAGYWDHLEMWSK